jgi:hypothetical protein
MAYAQAMNPDPRTQRLDKGPWYREPWPWIIMSGPAVVVVAGVVTAWIAFDGFDGLVADDYYKQGLSINKVLAREQRATELGLSAKARWDPVSGATDLALEAKPGVALPATVRLRLVHPTRSGHDKLVEMAAVAPGRYAGVLKLDASGQWRARVETAEWRFDSDWNAMQK